MPGQDEVLKFEGLRDSEDAIARAPSILADELLPPQYSESKRMKSHTLDTLVRTGKIKQERQVRLQASYTR